MYIFISAFTMYSIFRVFLFFSASIFTNLQFKCVNLVPFTEFCNGLRKFYTVGFRHEGEKESDDNT